MSVGKVPSAPRRTRARRFLHAALAAASAYALFCWVWQYSGRPWPATARVEDAAGAFALAASPRVARTEAGGTACAGRFYLVGGIGGFAGTLTSFEGYDPAADAWETLPDLPRPVNHPGVVAAEDRVWVVGGFGPLGLRLRGFMFARWDPLTEVSVYDPRTRTWSEAPPLPAPRGAGGVAVADGAIWYCGGIDEGRGLSADLFRFDLAERRWERRAPMPTARDHLRLEAVGGSLFALSGRRDDLRHNLAVVERYDVATDTWTRAADIPLARGGFGSVVHDGAIWTFGGEEVWTCSDAVERYDPAADRWERAGSLPEARHGICAGVIGGRIHLVSGGLHPRVSVSDVHRVLSPRVR